MKTELRWKALDPAPDKPVFQLLDATHPLKFYVGREMTGGYLFLLVDSERPPPIKGLRAVQITSFERPDGQWALLLSLVLPELSGIFSLLCDDLVACSSQLPTGSPGAAFVGRRLANWRRLLEEGAPALLAPGEVRGLFGELWFLHQYLLGRLGINDAVQAWGGPFGADQDFQAQSDTWEVKTIRPDAPEIFIASERQLKTNDRTLTLTVLALSESSEGKGRSLNDMVADLRRAVADNASARDALDARLDAAGYLVRDEYIAPKFVITSARTFLVEKDFPRLIPPSIPLGILDVRYKIALEACSAHETECPFEVDPT